MRTPGQFLLIGRREPSTPVPVWRPQALAPSSGPVFGLSFFCVRRPSVLVPVVSESKGVVVVLDVVVVVVG